nr:MAG TPA: YopX protein [Caudoviricetes sp.]
MIPKYRMWNEIASRLHSVDGLYFDREVAQYKDVVGVSRFIKFKNTILMQSTCLYDENGKEIFEGDIVQFEDYYIESDLPYINRGIVEWSQGQFTITNRASVEMEDLLDGEFLDLTIIGNIYENPELLQEQNKE